MTDQELLKSIENIVSFQLYKRVTEQRAEELKQRKRSRWQTAMTILVTDVAIVGACILFAELAAR